MHRISELSIFLSWKRFWWFIISWNFGDDEQKKILRSTKKNCTVTFRKTYIFMDKVRDASHCFSHSSSIISNILRNVTMQFLLWCIVCYTLIQKFVFETAYLLSPINTILYNIMEIFAQNLESVLFKVHKLMPDEFCLFFFVIMLLNGNETNG